jgi:hypothetical protein
MFKKTLLGILLILLSCLTPVAAAPLPAGLTEVSAAQVWPNKISWIGQKAVFLPAKMYQNVSYLFLYQDPTAALSGVDQLSLGKSLLGKTLTIKGLYKLKKDAATEYYWYLAADSGNPAVWLKDSQDTTLGDQPFALETEVAKEKIWIDKLAALQGITVWNNCNIVTSFAKSGSAEHLAPLTIHEFRSDGPFSEKYQLLFTKEDGSLLDWTIGLGTTPPAYNHQQFYELLKKSFYLKSPYDAHPGWSADRWTAIRARKIAVGMDQEMVILSWGAAKQVEGLKDHTEIWEYYGNRFLFFKDKALIKIKVPKPPGAKDTKDPKNTKEAKPKPDQPKYMDSGLTEVTEAGPVEKSALTDTATAKQKEAATTGSSK